MVGTFFAIDVETANADMASICQIGLVRYDGHQEVFARSWLIDPRDSFWPYNIALHGITPEMVAGSPVFSEVAPELSAIVSGQVLVSHTHFDRISTYQACALCELDHWPCTWLDSARVVRRTWPDFARTGYGLKKIAKHLGIDFRHHDALEDARAAAQVLLRACEMQGLTITDWLERVGQPIDPSHSGPIRREGNEEGSLAGERVVFTGSLAIPRRQAADMAAALGAAVDSGVTKKTTIVVVGDRDIAREGWAEKSAKHLRAEELCEQGYDIRIIGERDFLKLTEMIG